MKALFGASLALGAFACGCSAKTTTVEVTDAAPPTALSYTIDFQNQSNAVGSALVQVVVFDASKNASDTASRIAFCADLIDRRTKRQDFPADTYKEIARTALISPCDMIPSSSAAKPAGEFTVGYGTYAVLVVAQKGSGAADEIFIGCGVGDVAAAGSGSVTTVSLNPFDRFTEVPPYPQCNSLVNRCNGVANCPTR